MDISDDTDTVAPRSIGDESEQGPSTTRADLTFEEIILRDQETDAGLNTEALREDTEDSTPSPTTEVDAKEQASSTSGTPSTPEQESSPTTRANGSSFVAKSKKKSGSPKNKYWQNPVDYEVADNVAGGSAGNNAREVEAVAQCPPFPRIKVGLGAIRGEEASSNGIASHAHPRPRRVRKERIAPSAEERGDEATGTEGAVNPRPRRVKRVREAPATDGAHSTASATGADANPRPKTRKLKAAPTLEGSPSSTSETNPRPRKKKEGPKRRTEGTVQAAPRPPRIAPTPVPVIVPEPVRGAPEPRLQPPPLPKKRYMGIMMDRQEKAFTKKLIKGVLISAMEYPITALRHLMKIGYEPYPLVRAKRLISRREHWCLPNLIDYGRRLCSTHGGNYDVLFVGCEAYCVMTALRGIGNYFFNQHIDRNYRRMGGIPKNLTAEEVNLSHGDSLQRAVRTAFRQSVNRVFLQLISRPFYVVMARQLAQLVGREMKYTSMVQSIVTIGREEGPAGFFGGLVPAIIGDFFIIWSSELGRYLLNRLCVHFGLFQRGEFDSLERRIFNGIIFFLRAGIPYWAENIFFHYQVIGITMAIKGSGIAACNPPFCPITSGDKWYDIYNGMDRYGLRRGFRVFNREYYGKVMVRTEGGQRQYFTNYL